jgi:fibronectin type 3 domain-containing protein
VAACAAVTALFGMPASALAAPSAPTALLAASPTNVQPTLSWSPPASPGSGVTGYNVYRGGTLLTSTPITATTYTDLASLTQGSLAYTVTALDASGEGPAAAITVVYDKTAPAAPTALSGTTPTAQRPVLTWTASTDLTGIARYDVYRGSTLAGSTAGTTFTDAGLAQVGSQTYTVKAVDGAGNVSGSSAGKAIVYDNLPPSAPVLSAPAATNVAPALSWPAVTDQGGSTVAGYQVFRNGAFVGTTTTLTFSDTTVSAAGSYTYVVYALDGAGNVSTASNAKTVQYETTPPSAPGVPTSAALTHTAPVITFTAATDNAGGSGLQGYRIYRNGTYVNTTQALSFTDSTAAGNAIYTYTVTAIDKAGNEGPANGSVTVTYDTGPPSVPLSLQAATPTNQPPSLTWAASTDGLSGVVRYDVYRGASLVGSVPFPTTAFVDSGLTQQGSISYTVKSVDAAGNVSAASTAKAVIYDVTAPIPPTLSAPAATNAGPTLSWTVSSDAGGSNLNRYEVYRGGVLLGSPSNPTATTYTDASATTQGTYTYVVKAVDNAGNVSVSSNQVTVIVDTTPPGAPGALNALTPTNARPSLTFGAATDSGGAGVASYQIFRSGALVGTTPALSYVDSGATGNTSSAYTVRAVDAAGNAGPFTAAIQVVYDTTAPPVPTGLNGVTPTASVPDLTWMTGGPDNLSGLDHYAIYRGSTLVGTTAPGVTELVDALISTPGTQSYTVKAVDAAGNVSGPSSARSIVWDPLAPGAPGKPTIPSPTVHPALTYTAATDTGGSNVARYDVYRDGTYAGSATGVSFTDPAALADGHYSYTVIAVDGAGNRSVASASTTVTVDATPPGAPTGLGAPTPTALKPVLSWLPATDNAGGSGVAKYNVYRGTTLAGTSIGTTFTDTTVTVNGTYSYTVKAVDAAGNEGPASAPFSVAWDNTPPPTPTNLLAATPTSAAPVLSWTSGGTAADFDHYDVYRGATLLGHTTANSFEDDGLLQSGTYSYTVKAVDVNGNVSTPSAVRTVLYDVTPPTAPATLTIASPTRLPVLSWTASSDVGGSLLAGYQILRGGVLIASVSGLSYTDTSAADGVYDYAVRAVDNAGNVSSPTARRSVQIDTQPPPAPLALAADRSPTNAPHLTWQQASDADTGGTGISGYRVYRNGVSIGTTPAALFSDTTLVSDDTYTYTVAAIDGAGNEGPQSSGVSVLYDGTPPPVPLSLQVPALSQSRPQLTWVSGGPDALSGFDHYDVLRDGVVIGQSTSETFTDSSLSQNGTHVYSVRSVDAAGAASAPSVSRTATWDDTPPSVPLDLVAPTPTNSVRLSWTPSLDTGGAGGVLYHVLRNGLEIGTTTAPSYSDTDPIDDGRYSYSVIATDAAGNQSPQSDTILVTVDKTPPPPVPAAPDGATPTQRPAFTWTPVTDPSGIARYDVYRSGQLAGSSVVPSFVDNGIAVDGTYAYTVVAVDAAGNSSQPTPPLNVVFDHTAPRAPGQPLAVTPTASIPALTWASGGPDNLSGFARYDVYRDGVLAGTTTAPSFVDAEVNTSGAHSYTVRAVDNAGNASPPSPPEVVVYDTLAPPTPNDLGVPTPTNAPSLSWTAVSDDGTGGSGVVGYRIYRDGSILATTTAPRYTDASLGASGSHAYWVTAVDAVGNESLASTTRVVFADLDPPPAPADLGAPTPTNRPVLTWAASTDAATGNSGIDHYNVYRDGLLIARSAVPSYMDSHVTVSGRFTYTVRAVDGAGNTSDQSAPAVVDVDVTGPELHSLAIPRSDQVGTPIDFSVIAVDPQGASVSAPTWSFGDGEASGSSVTHTYQHAGVYSVTVTARDAVGNATTSVPTTITITPRAARMTIAPIAPRKVKQLAKARWRVRSLVTVDQPADLILRLVQGRRIVMTTTTSVATGTTPIWVTVPKIARKAGQLRLTVNAQNSTLSASATLVLRR